MKYDLGSMDAEKTIQFLLDQQAKFDARQAQLDERLARFSEQSNEQLIRFSKQSNERMTRAEQLLLDIAAAQERTNEIVATLAEKDVALAASHEAIVVAHKATEEALHSLIDVVERHIANHRHDR